MHDTEAGYEKAGAVYVFRYNGSDWVREAKLIASDPEVWHLFGMSVSISGDVAIVGAINDSDAGFRAGAALRVQGETERCASGI